MLGLETEARPSLGTDRPRPWREGWVQFGKAHQARISLPSCALWLKGARACLHQPSEGLLVAGRRPVCTLNPPTDTPAPVEGAHPYLSLPSGSCPGPADSSPGASGPAERMRLPLPTPPPALWPRRCPVGALGQKLSGDSRMTRSRGPASSPDRILQLAAGAGAGEALPQASVSVARS